MGGGYHHVDIIFNRAYQQKNPVIEIEKSAGGCQKYVLLVWISPHTDFKTGSCSFADQFVHI